MTDPLPVFSNLRDAAASGLSVERHQVSPPDGGIQPNPVISGTEGFAEDFLVRWHQETHHWPERDVALYSIGDAVISGAGQIWLDGRLITSDEVMPRYVANLLDLTRGGTEQLRTHRTLPVRAINEPTVVAIGHGTRVYGHFLIELLFRILLVRRALSKQFRYRFLLDYLSPPWMLDILDRYLGIGISEIEFFRHDQEQVLLRHAIVPALLLQADRFLPFANDLLSELMAVIPSNGEELRLSRAFISRKGFQNPSAPYRVCANEQNLIDIACKKYDFVPVLLEDMKWRDQISLFRNADVIVGLAGSGLHNALFSNRESRLASVGMLNLVQSQIGALRGQRNAFLSKGIVLSREFSVDEDVFGTFLKAVCDSS